MKICSVAPLALAFLIGTQSGCTSLNTALNAILNIQIDNREAGDDPNDNSAPVVFLSVSDPAPAPFDEVTLRCDVLSGDATSLTFAFEPSHLPLLTNPGTGVAFFIVDQSDVGREFAFSCTATNSYGTSRPSNEQVVIPASLD